jgi:hypothetical protein
LSEPDVLPQPTSTADRLAALPVELDLHGRHADSVRAWIEGTLGWQPVAGATAGLVPPAVVLRDLGSAHVASAGSEVPSVLLVDDGAPPQLTAEVAARTQPDAVLVWPGDRDTLVDRVATVVGRPRRSSPAGPRLCVGGSAGGVGSTTVTLALAGLAAWHGAASLAVVRGNGLNAPVVPAAALQGVGVWARAEPLPGVPGARAVRVVGPAEVPPASDPEIGMVVLDIGVDAEVDVLVCRPDGAALEVLAVTTAAAVVVMGPGPVSLRDLRRAAAGRRGIVLPWSARVARAGLAGRVPAGIPGAWLQRLRPLLPQELRRPG